VAEDAIFDDGQDKADQADDEQPKGAMHRHDHAGGENPTHDEPNQNDQKNVHAADSLINRRAQASRKRVMVCFRGVFLKNGSKQQMVALGFRVELDNPFGESIKFYPYFWCLLSKDFGMRSI